MSLVALIVTLASYATHPHHPRAVWWLTAAVAVFALWAFEEMLRWRIRHNRLKRELDRRSLAEGSDVHQDSLPLHARYEQREPYRLPAGGTFLEHRVGIRNPAGNPVATGVRLEWTGLSPRPAMVGPQFAPAVPCKVPRLSDGDPATGISLPAGQEELWVAVCTSTAPDGTMNAGEFGPGHGSSRGNWHGTPWILESGGQWRLTYRIVADSLPAATFSIVMTAAGGEVRCDLEG